MMEPTENNEKEYTRRGREQEEDRTAMRPKRPVTANNVLKAENAPWRIFGCTRKLKRPNAEFRAMRQMMEQLGAEYEFRVDRIKGELRVEPWYGVRAKKGVLVYFSSSLIRYSDPILNDNQLCPAPTFRYLIGKDGPETEVQNEKKGIKVTDYYVSHVRQAFYEYNQVDGTFTEWYENAYWPKGIRHQEFGHAEVNRYPAELRRKIREVYDNAPKQNPNTPKPVRKRTRKPKVAKPVKAPQVKKVDLPNVGQFNILKCSNLKIKLTRSTGKKNSNNRKTVPSSADASSSVLVCTKPSKRSYPIEDPILAIESKPEPISLSNSLYPLVEQRQIENRFKKSASSKKAHDGRAQNSNNRKTSVPSAAACSHETASITKKTYKQAGPFDCPVLGTKSQPKPNRAIPIPPTREGSFDLIGNLTDELAPSPKKAKVSEHKANCSKFTQTARSELDQGCPPTPNGQQQSVEITGAQDNLVQDDGSVMYQAGTSISRNSSDQNSNITLKGLQEKVPESYKPSKPTATVTKGDDKMHILSIYAGRNNKLEVAVNPAIIDAAAAAVKSLEIYDKVSGANTQNYEAHLVVHPTDDYANLEHWRMQADQQEAYRAAQSIIMCDDEVSSTNDGWNGYY